MEIDYTSVSVPGAGIERMLRRLEELVQLAKQGFDYAIPELRILLSTGQQLTGFMVAYDPSSTLVLHSLQRGGVTNTVYLESSGIIGVELMNIGCYPLLCDLQRELHFSKGINRIQLLHELEAFEQSIRQKTGSEISYSIDTQVDSAQIPAIFNMAQVVKAAIEKTAQDEAGRRAVSDIASIRIADCEQVDVSLADGVLSYLAPYRDRGGQLSVAEMVSRLAALL